MPAKKLAKIEPKKIAADELKDAKAPESEWKENVIAITIFVVIVLGILAFYNGWFTSDEPEAPADFRYDVGVDDDAMLGDPNAPVTIIEFSDYLCQACAHFHVNTFDQLKASYIDTGKANFVFRDYPIQELHSQTLDVAATVNCAGEQDRFWEFHHAFYEQQARISEQLVNETALANGVNMTVLNECRASRRQHQEAERDEQHGLLRGEVTSTPTFFINGVKIIGSQSYETFAETIEEALEKV